MILCTFKDEDRRLARLAIEACNTQYHSDLKLESGGGIWQVVADDMLVTPNQGSWYATYITGYVAGMEKALERIAIHLREALAGAIL